MSLLNRPPKTLEELYFSEIRPNLYALHGTHKQTGVRESRTLAQHLDSACQFCLTVSRLASVPEKERAVLLAATAVHDLNKLDESKGSVKKLARNKTFLQGQLERASVNTLVPGDDELELTRRLIERHSGHNVSDGARFLPEDPNIERWASILRSADLFDLELSDQDLIRKIRTELIHALGRPCNLFRVWVSEEQGYITALLLSACQEVLQEQGFHPLALYPNGILFEGEDSPSIDLTAEIAVRWQIKINQVFGGNIEQLVKATKDGIKVLSQAVQHNHNEVIDVVLTLLEKKKFGVKLEKVQSDVRKWSEQKVNTAALQQATQVGLLPVENAEEFAVAEGLKAAYLSYREIEPALSTKQVWNRIAQHAGLSEPQQVALEPFDALYGRPLFAAKAAINGMEGVVSALKDSLQIRRGETNVDNTNVSEVMLDAVRRSLNCPMVQPINGATELSAYIEANPRQRCSLGATIATVESLSSDKMPIGTKVQMFSNRLPGGMTSEPVRQADPMAALAYQLMTVGAHFPSAKKEPPFYLHLALPPGSSPDFLSFWRDWLKNAAATNAEGGPVSINDLKLYQCVDPKNSLEFRANKVVGFAFPKRTEFIHTTVIIPIMMGDDNASLGLLKSLRLALELSLTVGFRFSFVLNSSMEIDSAAFCGGRVEGIPSSLQPLLGSGRYVFEQYSPTQSFQLNQLSAQLILSRLQCLGRLAIAVSSLAKVDDCLYDLARACSQPFSLYYVLLRWILREQDDSNLTFNWSRIREPLHTLLESLMPDENSPLTRYLRNAAQVAVEAQLWGSSTDKRTSLAEPFTEFIAAVRSQKTYMDLDFMFGALVQKYHTRLKRIRDFEVKGTKFEQLKDYYGILRKLYEGVYQGRPDKLLSDQNNLEAAYLFFLTEARREFWEKRNQNEQSENSAA